MNYNYLILILV